MGQTDSMAILGNDQIVSKCGKLMMIQTDEVKRLAETEITQGTLKFSKLMSYIAQASRKITKGPVTLSALTPTTPSSTTSKQAYRPVNASNTEKRTCFIARKLGI